MKRPIILIGLPGAGKSTVGRLLAEALDAEFEDVDVEIERREGQRIAAIFSLRGEQAFRAMEREEVLRALEGVPRVLSAGGGWAAEPGNLDEVAGRALIVHLTVDPDEAAERISGSAVRPLLAGDERERLRELAAARAPSYARADASVSTSGRTPADVTEEVVQLARSRAGW